MLHHPDFQTVESLWRSVELLVRNLETGAKLEIVLLDVTAEEFAADLSRADSLDQTGLYRLLVEQPALDAAQGPFAAIVGNYTFEQTPPHAELLGRMAKLAYAARAPFLAAVSNDYLKKPKPEDVHPLVTESWAKLRALPEAAYLGLVVPRFLLRLPYGKKTEPIDPFDFEEFSKREGLRSMPWGNGAFVATLLLAQTFQKQGLKSMKLGSILSVGDMPYHYFTDDDGDQVALPCTDRLMTEALAAHAAGQGLMALVSLKGRPEVRLAGFQSPAGKQLLGPWSSETITPSAGSGRSAGSSSDAPSDDSATADEPTAAAEAASEAGESSSDSGGDDELAALLASLESPSTESSESGGEEVDPELAALLANL